MGIDAGVYLVLAKSGLYKIGCTSNISRRMLALRKILGSAELVAFIETEETYRVERCLHDVYPDKRLSGELFSLTPDDVEYIKSLRSYHVEALLKELQRKAKERFIPGAFAPYLQPPKPLCVWEAEQKRVKAFQETMRKKRALLE